MHFNLSLSRIGRYLLLPIWAAWIITTGVLFSSPSAVLASDVESLLILPFNLNAPSNLGHVQKGVMAMLSSRLTNLTGKPPLTPETTSPSLLPLPDRISPNIALDLARQAQARYVVFGSISLFGSQVSSDAFLYDVKLKIPVLSFSRAGTKVEDLPDHIIVLVSKIRDGIASGHHTPRPSAGADIGTSGTGRSTGPAQSNASGSAIPPRDETVSAAAKQIAGTASRQWQSPSIDLELGGMAAGDVDADGRTEICVISKDTLLLYRWEQGKLVKLDSMKCGAASLLLGVDIADVDHNGFAEIFVTSYHELGQHLNSFVVEWDGTAFRRIQDRLNWFFRSFRSPGHDKKRIMGQKMGSGRLYDRAGIFEIAWINKGYRASDRVEVPAGIDIHDFAYGDLHSDGTNLVAAFTENGNLSFCTMDGDVLWQSKKTYGGTTNSLAMDPSLIGTSVSGYQPKIQVYLQPRILLTDLDHNGRSEAIVVNNHDALGRHLTQVRRFTSGAVEVLTWEGIEPAIHWRSGEVSGHISDCMFEDITHDGRPELVAIHVQRKKGASLLNKHKSHIISWPVESKKDKNL